MILRRPSTTPRFAALPLLAALLAALLLPLAAAPAAATHISINVDDDDDVRVDGDEIVITAEDDSEATVEPDGTLRVDGRRVAMAERDRQALVLYNRTLRNVKDRAIELGVQGAGLALHAVTEAVVAVATGKPERAERRVERHAEDLKDNARRLCQEMREVEQLQDTVAARVAAFRPYAVIELDEDDCQVDD